MQETKNNFSSKEQASFNFMAAVTICSDFKFTTKFLEYSFFSSFFFLFFFALLFSFESFCCHIFKFRVSFLNCFQSTNEPIEDLLVLLISNISYCCFCIIYIFCLCYSIFAYLFFSIETQLFKNIYFWLLWVLVVTCGIFAKARPSL